MTTDTLDMDELGALAESVCAQLAAHGERTGLDEADLAAALALASSFFLLGSLSPTQALDAWGRLDQAVRAVINAVGEQAHGRLDQRPN